MKRLVHLFRNDVRRRVRAPMSVLLMLAIPLLMTWIIGLVFAPKPGQNQLPKIRVLAVNLDEGMGGKFFLGAFDQGEGKKLFQLTLTDEASGRKRMAEGKASALIVIPADFTRRIVRRERARLLLEKNPAEQFLPAVVEEFVGTLAVIVSGMGQVFAEELQGLDALSHGEWKRITVTDLAPQLEKARQKMVVLNALLDPLLLQIKKGVVGKKKEEPEVNLFALVLPGLAIMFLMFVVEIFLRDLLTERENGRLRRMMFSPLAAHELILARILGAGVMGLLVLGVIAAAGSLMFAIDWIRLPYLLLLSTVTCLCLTALFGLLNGLFRNRNQAEAFTSPLILVFSAFGGSIMPVNQLPGLFQMASRLTPNYWFIQGVTQTQSGRFPGPSLAVLLAAALVLFPLAVWALRRRICR